MKSYFFAASLLGFGGILGAQDASAPRPVPVPVDQEPLHHVVLRNDSIIVMHVVIPAGERSLYHIHSHDRLAIELSTSPITQQNLDEAEGPIGTVQPGDFSIRTQEVAPLIHRVHNTGTTPFEVLDIEFLQRPQKPSSSAAATTAAAENPSARVYKWALAPGAVSPMHTHERPYLIVSATPMQLKMTAPDGKSQSQELKPGDFHWVDSKVTHALSNEGASAGQLFEVELK